MLDDRLTIGCAQGSVGLMQLQRAGRGALAAQEFLRGARLGAGLHLAGA